MQSITLDNFRVFSSPQTFSLTPLTVLTGRNNSGKSSLIKAFLVLADFLEQSDQTALRLDGPRASKHRITSFEELLNREVSLLGRQDLRLGYSKGQYEFTYEFEASPLVHAHSAALTRFCMLNQATGAELLLIREEEHYRLEVPQDFINCVTDTEREDMYYNALNAVEDGITEQEYLINQVNALDATEEDEQLLEHLSIPDVSYDRTDESRGAKRREDDTIRSTVHQHELQNDAPSLWRLIQYGLIKYIGGNNERRQQQYRFGLGGEHKVLVEFIQRVNILMGFRPDHLGPNRTHQERLIRAGSSTGEIARIAEDFVRYRVASGVTASAFLNKWLERFEIGHAMVVEQLEGTTYRIQVYRDGQHVNLADMGFGAGQLLSILLLIAINIQRRELEGNQVVSFQHNVKLLIEEPEANLHPRLQSMLAEMFLEAACTHWVALLIETHSEYMIRKLQFLVAAGQYEPGYVILHYVDRVKQPHHTLAGDAQTTSYEMECRMINIESDGTLSAAFGSGFFDEAGDVIMAMNDLQRKQIAL